MIAQRRASYAGYATRELYLEGDGPTVVLAHGFGDSADTWRGVLAELAKAGRAAVAADLPGFGHADPLRPGPQLPQLDEFFAELLGKHRKAIVAGNSLGGAVAVRAAQRPELDVHGVVPICAVGMGMKPVVELLMRGEGRLLRAAQRVTLSQRLVDAGIRAGAPRLLYADRRLADPEVVARMSLPFSVPGAAALLLRAGAVYTREVRGSLEPARVRCPMVVVHGALDRLVPVAASRRLHAAAPGSTLVILPRAGHCPQLDDPRTIARLILGC